MQCPASLLQYTNVFMVRCSAKPSLEPRDACDGEWTWPATGIARGSRLAANGSEHLTMKMRCIGSRAAPKMETVGEDSATYWG